MAGAMRKVAVYLGLVEDQGRYDGDFVDEQYDEFADEYPVQEPESARGLPPESDSRERERSATVATLAERRPMSVASASRIDSARIVTLHPRTYNEARTLGEHFRDGTPVIMNLSEMDDTDAKRLVDFSAGLIFGLRGDIERVTAKVFLLSPADVTVTAEDKARIASGGFFNQS
ncbi:MAG TPA: cell division protein SepF [Jiangellaceae bacterium]|jgi:cell division inhibitor SepF|nr:cell division protein SepF [Jiangellaceae bacterium]